MGMDAIEIGAFAEEVGLIKEAVSAQWISKMVGSGMKKQPLWKRAITYGGVGTSPKGLQMAERLVGRRAARVGMPETLKAVRTARGPREMVQGIAGVSRSRPLQRRMATELGRSPEFAATSRRAELIGQGVRAVRKGVRGLKAQAVGA